MKLFDQFGHLHFQESNLPIIENYNINFNQILTKISPNFIQILRKLKLNSTKFWTDWKVEISSLENSKFFQIFREIKLN